MGLFKKLFAQNKKSEPQNELEQLASLFPGTNVTNTAYNTESSIASLIDTIGEEEGGEALEKATILLYQDNEVAVVFGDYSGGDSDVKSFVKVTEVEGVSLQLLKSSAGKRDNLSHMAVDLASREIYKALIN